MRAFTPVSFMLPICLLFGPWSLLAQASFVNYEPHADGKEVAQQYYQQGNNFLDEGDLDAANSAYTQSLAHYHQHQKARFNRAYVLFHLKHYEAAIFDFDLVLIANRNDAEALELRGLSYFYLSNFEKAEENFTDAIALNSRENLYIHRGRAYGKMGYYREAFRDFDVALRINPRSYEAHSRKAEIFASIRQYEAALDWYDKALNIFSGDALIYNNRGSVLCKMGRYEDAVRDFTTALSIEWQVQIFTNRGLCHIEGGSLQAARWDGIAAMHLNPDAPDAYFCVGLSEMGREDYKAAIKSFDIAIMDAPDVFQYFLSRSRAKMMLHQFYPALEDCYKALELEPESEEADDLLRLLFDSLDQSNQVMMNAMEMPNNDNDRAPLEISMDPVPFDEIPGTEEYLFEDPYGKGN